jgi:tRNA (guanine-N7-)-methyltransferase
MPRRQLRKLDPLIDLSHVLRSVDDLPAELTSESLFGNSRPLELEIGSGKGLFLTAASEATAEHNFVGIEIAQKYAQHAAARLARAGRDNALMIAGDAGPLLASRFPDGSLTALHVYFPDPWWKKKHKRRRVLNEALLRSALRILAPGGRFHFWTDVLDYFESTLDLIAQVVPQLGPPIPEEAAPAEHDLDYRTHFERRSRQHDIPVYRVRFEKPAG